MRYLLTILAVLLLCAGLVSCDEAKVGQQIETAGQAAQAVGQATGFSILSLVGSLAAGVGAVLAGKKASVGATYATGGWTRDETAELVAALRAHGYKVDGPTA